MTGYELLEKAFIAISEIDSNTLELLKRVYTDKEIESIKFGYSLAMSSVDGILKGIETLEIIKGKGEF